MAAAVRAPVVDDPSRLRLRWVLGLRWAGLVSQLVVIAVTVALADFAVGAFAVVAVGAVSNGLLHLWFARASHDGDPRRSERVLAAAVVADLVLLTVLLAMTGGPLNPFTLLYLVHVATVAVALPRASAIAVTAIAVAAYGVLFSPGIFDPVEHMHQMHGPGFASHIRGMWIAFAITASFVVVFVGQLRRSLDDRALRLDELRHLDERSRRLASLATLAGGAAHELSSPLQSIAVIADALARGLKDKGQSGALVDDTALLQAEVRRCKHVLAQLAVDAGTPGGEPDSTCTLRELVDDAAASSGRVRVNHGAGSDVVVVGPRRALTLALRGVLKNALQADAGTVDVDVGADAEVIVRDHGRGMSAAVLQRAGEPFFSTKDPGDGMGLGLFLATTVFDNAGGSLRVSSTEGAGTTVRLTFATSKGVP